MSSSRFFRHLKSFLKCYRECVCVCVGGARVRQGRGYRGIRQELLGGTGLGRVLLRRIYSNSEMCVYQQQNQCYSQKTIWITKIV